MYRIFKCVWHVYSGHLLTNLSVYILQMLWKFRICPPSFTWTQGLCVSSFPHFFWDNYLDTRVVFFGFSAHCGCFFCGFSAHSWDMYCICTCVWHIYSRHLPTKLLVYILKMLRKFHTFPGTITRTPGCFFWVFCTLLGHVLHFYLCVAYLSGTFTQQIICVHLADAPDISHFSQDNYPDTWVVLFRFSAHLHVPGMCEKPEKNNLVSG